MKIIVLTIITRMPEFFTTVWNIMNENKKNLIKQMSLINDELMPN